MEGTNWEEEDGTKVMIDPIAPRQPPPPPRAQLLQVFQTVSFSFKHLYYYYYFKLIRFYPHAITIGSFFVTTSAPTAAPWKSLSSLNQLGVYTYPVQTTNLGEEEDLHHITVVIFYLLELDLDLDIDKRWTLGGSGEVVKEIATNQNLCISLVLQVLTTMWLSLSSSSVTN